MNKQTDILMRPASNWRVAFAIRVLRPYIARELPGWGYLYNRFVGSYENDTLWRGQRVRYAIGKLHGYRMRLHIDGWANRATYFLRRWYDLPTQLLAMKLIKSGDTVVDAGANEGMMSLLAARLVGASGLVIAFEPNPAPRAIFQDAIDYNEISQIELHATGVSDAAGVLVLFVPTINSGEGSFTNIENIEGHSIQCPVVVGDDAIAGRKVDFIKIDVEGLEMRVLRGFESTIKESQPVVVTEMVAEHLMRDRVTPAEICAYFNGLGYVGRKIGSTRSAWSHALRISSMPTVWEDGDYVWLPQGHALID